MSLLKGKFITFEGGEGSGKSTQIKLLSDYLASKHISNMLTREPGGTEFGNEMRKILLTGDANKLDDVSETLLFYVDRRVHLVQKIWPAMSEGTWVISDRFADSTTAYQHYGHGQKVSKEDLDCIYKVTAGDFEPDLTIILDIDPKIGLSRSYAKAEGMEEKEIRFEGLGLEFHNNLRYGYLEIAKNNPNRCVVLDANKTVAELHNDIVKVINERFKI